MKGSLDSVTLTEVVGLVLLAALTVAGFAARAAPPPLIGEAAGPTTLRALYGLTPPARLAAARTALLLVDFEDEFFHGRLPLTGGAAAVTEAARLVTWARAAGLLVVHVRHVAAGPGGPLFAPGSSAVSIAPEVSPRPGELQITKSIAGAFSRTDLDLRLRARGIDTLIVAGLMTHLAVMVTASDALVLGYRVIVASDATASRALPAAGPGADAQVAPATIDAATVHRVALAIMGDRAADVLTAGAISKLPVDGAPADASSGARP